MGEIADMGSGVLHHASDLFQQGIEFMGERRDLRREIAFEPFRAPGPDIDQPGAQPVERIPRGFGGVAVATDRQLRQAADRRAVAESAEGRDRPIFVAKRTRIERFAAETR